MSFQTPSEPTDHAAERPLVSILLIAYRQEQMIADAVRGALAQTYTPLEILISDDASPDGTFDAIEAAVAGYDGPHRIVLNRNPRNLGISAHLSALAGMAQGELLVVAAGDDISVPERCARVVETWLAHARRPDLIASDLIGLDSAGQTHGPVAPTDLSGYRGVDDWLARPPHLVGAAHAWSRRLFERFGPMQPGTAAEDQIMTFRAVMSGGALSLREALVLYRDGGLSRKRRWPSVAAYIEHLRRSNRYSLAELAQLYRDADTAGVGPRLREALAAKQAREDYTRDVFEAPGLMARVRLLRGAHGAKFGLRVRMFLYAACPAVYAPLFLIKRLRQRR
jgi:glycosyltransferase involved in cell wall biosynthesis